MPASVNKEKRSEELSEADEVISDDDWRSNQNVDEEEPTNRQHRIAAALERSKEKTRHILKSSKSHIEEDFWLCPLRFIVHFPRTRPRVWAFVAGVLLPLWILIFIALGFGVLLTWYEMPEEVYVNDRILASREIIRRYEVNPGEILNLTSICLASWQLDALNRTDIFNEIFSDVIEDDLPGSSFSSVERGTTGVSNVTFLNDTVSEPDDMVLVDLDRLTESVQTCVDSYTPSIDEYEAAQQRHLFAIDPLSFNWIRCWNETYFGDARLIFNPSIEMIEAARPVAQAEFFRQEWLRSQEEWFRYYLPDNATPIDVLDAFFKSVEQATGGGVCAENMGGTAWFFFTVMTTVGYGNQAPVTSEGRLLISTAGLLSSVLFGAVLGLCGYISLAIFDDAVRRVKYASILSKPLVGIFLWGSIWLCFALVVAKDVETWWNVRIPEYGKGINREDSLWFAFISTSTIGLGDYYLQPETFFTGDALKYSLYFLIGFVFLSNFVGKIAESLSALLPKQHNSLESRLAATKIISCWPSSLTSLKEDQQQQQEQQQQESTIFSDPNDDALQFRIEQLKKMKPNLDEDETNADSSLVISLRGNSSHSVNLALLVEEETLLREWLAVVERQQSRAMSILEGESIHAHDPPLAENNSKKSGTLESGISFNSKTGEEEVDSGSTDE